MTKDFTNYIHKEGWKFIAIAVAIAFILGIVAEGSLILTIPICIWVVAFFRDPERSTPLRDDLVISPADGIIQSIKLAQVPKELVSGKKVEALRVAIFMNVFDCHVNRSPIAGKILAKSYRKGAFFNASLDKASVKNERSGLAIKANNGQVFYVVQIAGLVARRIICWSKKGENLQTGQRFGMIRFGSRVDVYLPEKCQPMLVKGMRVRAGETIIASLLGSSGSADKEGKKINAKVS